MALYSTEAVVLRTQNLGEADKILTLFTENRGKVRAVARGSRRPRNHLMGSSQPFVHGSFMIFRGKNLDSVSQATIIDPMVYLREDLLKMAHASYIVELVDLLTEEYDPNSGLFTLLTFVLRQMRTDGMEARLLKYFELHLLSLIGIEPQLACCVGCGVTIVPDGDGNPLGFSTREGGVLCAGCRKERTDALPLSLGSLQAMRWLANADGDRLGILQIPTTIEREMEQLVRGFIDFHLQKPLKSLEFLHTIRG